MWLSNSTARELKPEQKIAAHTLDRHLSVTAGPGAGKTTVLVERYLEILRTKNVSVDNIVAITFTNRAANEMRQRVRERIDTILREASPKERQTWLRHKRTLEGAVITTIHGLCSRLLHEFPVEANIDPQFVLLDEHQAAMLLESAVEDSLTDTIHHGNETILEFAQGTGRAALATALIELHRKYRDEGLHLEEIEKLTAANHASRSHYDSALKQLDATMSEFFSVRLTKAAAEKRGRAAQDWPALRAIVAEPPTEKSIAAYCQAIEDFWEARPQKRSHPVIERIDDLLWGEDPKANDHLRGKLPAIGFDLLAKKYSLELLKLLREIERRLDAEKQRLSALDFDDLQLRALRILERPEVLARVAERYRYFLVDEFQDTNALQRDLVSRLALTNCANLFIVGDRKQSIYGFRGADVDVFTELTAAIEKASGTQQPLRLNFRSQPPLIDSFNFLFAKIFQPDTEIPASELGELGYVEHEPSTAVRDAEHEPPLVELLLSAPRETKSFGESDQTSPNTLSAHERDAGQVAERIKALVDAGSRYKDIAILLRVFTGVWTYENALRRAGIPYLTVQGKGFYQREEITDLIQLLRFLDNTTDELALAAVLRSPLCGISDNALLALRCAPWNDEDAQSTHLRRRNLRHALRRHREIQFIEEAEHIALDRAASWVEALVQRRNRYGIADLLRSAVSSSEFMTVIAANFDAAQHVANIEKLFRLAEQFEGIGFLIRDFVHYVEDFEAVGGREGEGQMDESSNVVRLMTIHQAKGLEFPIVIIPDLHRELSQRNPSFLLDRHKGATVRIPDGRGRTVRGALFNELSQRSRWRESFESMRLLYVAATRARDRLILSGAVEQKSLANLTKTDNEKWLAWIWQALDLEEHSQTDVAKFEENVKIQVKVDRDSPAPPRSHPASSVESATEDAIDLSQPLGKLFPLLQPIAPEQGQVLRRFSVTQLINFQRCARQYYFDRMLRTPSSEERAVWNDAEAPEPPANLTATLKGAVIHRFCETFNEGEDAETRLQASFHEVKAQRQSELAGRAFDIDDQEAVRALLPLARNYLGSKVFKRVQAAERIKASTKSQFKIRNPQSSPGLWSELRFRLRRRLGILTGTIDKLLITPSAIGDSFDVEIIDFKTNRFPRGVSQPMRTSRSATGRATKAIATNALAQAGQVQFNFEAVSEEVVAEEVETIEAETSRFIEAQAEAVAHDYQLQMQSYALALRELLPAGVKVNTLRATLHFIDPNVEISLPALLLDQETCATAIDEAMNEIALLDATLDADRFPPVPASHCRLCNFLDLCPAGREWLRFNR